MNMKLLDPDEAVKNRIAGTFEKVNTSKSNEHGSGTQTQKRVDNSMSL